MASNTVGEIASPGPTTIGPGLILDGKWEILHCIGKGSFSEIYIARNILSLRTDKLSEQASSDPNTRLVAVKVQIADVDSNVLKWESSVLHSLEDYSNVPKLIKYGKIDVHNHKRDFVVMDLLTGDDMASIRNRIRSNSPTGLVPIFIASYFARQMLKCVRALHEKGFVHRDVKPSNFVRRNRQTSQFCVIDFGLAKQYREKNGELRPMKEKSEFRGTTVYASPFVHEGHDQCPRDDICSIMHAFFDMACGKLPWGDAARAKAKAQVAESKQYHYQNLDAWMKWEFEETSSTESKRSWQGHCNFPIEAQKNSIKIMTILKDMKYGEIPDYEEIETLLFDCVPESIQHNVGDLSFQCEGFSWSEGSNRLAEILQMLSKDDQIAAAKAAIANSTIDAGSGAIRSLGISAQLKAPPMASLMNSQPDRIALMSKNLLSLINPLLKSNSTQPADIYTTAVKWRNLARKLPEIPEQSLTMELMNAYFQVLRLHNGFFNMSLGDGDSKWQEFSAFQQTVGEFYLLYSKVERRFQLQISSEKGNANLNSSKEDVRKADGEDDSDLDRKRSRIETNT